MNSYRMYATSINERYLTEIVDALRRGETILYPTDSYYAIGCDALNNRAVERICKIKNINPAKQHLSMVCANISQASEYVRIDNNAFRILHSTLPGPYTYLLPATPKLAKAFRGRKEAGVRVPDNEIARRIAQELGHPLLSTSAIWDDADREELATADNVKLHFEKLIDIFVDGGDCCGHPTEVISLTDSASPEIIRST